VARIVAYVAEGGGPSLLFNVAGIGSTTAAPDRPAA
jgi:hypothetical protein